MRPNWTPLDTELDRWSAAGLSLPLWWRDDDAIAMTPALDRLQDLARRLEIPLHLAVIPAEADTSLAESIDPFMIPVVHGWSHTNHAPNGEKKAEFGAHRPIEEMHAETAQGMNCLRTLFGDAFVPMFVPPWNRVAAGLLPTLPVQGFGMLSTFTPRSNAFAAPGLTQINTHLDPINWRVGKTLHHPDILIRQIATQLSDRRKNRADREEPYGILTHHLVHDTAIWNFTEALLSRLLQGPTHIWTAHSCLDRPRPKETTHEPT
ncbi:polysaccharide deacetylase family protein [Sedimentitalea todarodis]|uniref:Polysaccharide deacetylase family protein n=1 Tax=Sedimentitalea todarodis TaxID=1631240 RepID=A0ABU3V7Z8_9RHOB|nr:polysaccharide deacetylase family protein [Sedimentitalea todarodis]MDU9002292.1 polysaccharide deacetylase family protein [Sedimentitalea todarodis]